MPRAGRKPFDLLGKRSGKLTAKRIAYKDKYNFWLCECDCGKETIIRSCSFGRTKSCGCLKIGNSGKKITHGMKGTRFYSIWNCMKTRCLSVNTKSYKSYGFYGIKVCDGWELFLNFKKDMYESYLKHVEEFGEKETTIDRKDSSGNYCLENCAWATWKEQSQNKRKKYRKKIA